jgi:hypothetical protein
MTSANLFLHSLLQPFKPLPETRREIQHELLPEQMAANDGHNFR